MDKQEKKDRIMNLKPKAIFGSRFEEKKACGYLLNLINSRILQNKPFPLFHFASDLLGYNRTIPKLLKLCSPVHHDRILDNDACNLSHYVPRQTVIHLLGDTIAPLLQKRVSKLSALPQSEMEKRLHILQETFKLSDHELEIAIFFYLMERNILEDIFKRDSIVNLTELPTFKSFMHTVLGLKRYDIAKVLTEGNLFKAALIEVNYNNDLSIAQWCESYLAGVGERNLSHDFFTMENDSALHISDFDLPEDELRVLDALIKSASSHNILFYGESGTGKTSLAKCLAKTYGKELLTVKVPISDVHKERLQRIYGTINIADKERSIILIDEADEVLNTSDSFFHKSITNKSWTNMLMEGHHQKIIWITNRFDTIHPSTMRRFSFCMEFHAFNAQKRAKVLTNEIRQRGFMDYFSEKDIQDLCRTYSVNAGSIVSALNILSIEKTTDKEMALKKIKAVLKNHEKVTTGKKISISDNRKDFSKYSLEGLNCSEDPEKIISIIQRYTEQQKAGILQITRPMSFLLYGMPGTGKSEFVYYLGHILDKEVALRRCSDIHSMWVGETEKNIANAFREAGNNNTILFFDEADSFLFPRREASHSWEKNFTNEILTQLESSTGIVIFATNDIEGLDHGSLRRFRFKIEFKSLTPEGNVHFYDTVLKPLIPQDILMSLDERRKLKSIINPTPGDFAVVRDKYAFIDQNGISHSELISALIMEVRYRQENGDLIGFR
jgi:transitional endoplasmic reticulum ATPase